MSTAGSLRPFSYAVHPPRDEHGHLQRVHPRRRESRSTAPVDDSNLAASAHGAPAGIFAPAAAQRERDARRVDLPKSDGHARRHGSHPRRSNDRRMAGFAFALEGRGDLGMATEVTPCPIPSRRRSCSGPAKNQRALPSGESPETSTTTGNLRRRSPAQVHRRRPPRGRRRHPGRRHPRPHRPRLARPRLGLAPR